MPWGWGGTGQGVSPSGSHVEWEAGSSAACLVLNRFIEPQARFCITQNSPVQSLHFRGLDKVPSSGLPSCTVTPRAPSSRPKEAGLPVDPVAPSPSQPPRPLPSLSAGIPQRAPQQVHFWARLGSPWLFHRSLIDGVAGTVLTCGPASHWGVLPRGQEKAQEARKLVAAQSGKGFSGCPAGVSCPAGGRGPPFINRTPARGPSMPASARPGRGLGQPRKAPACPPAAPRPGLV